MSEINPSIIKELTPLIHELEKRGFNLMSTQYGGMSYVAEFRSKDQSLSVVKDRGQWFVKGEKDKLEEGDLWRVHKSLGSFKKKLLLWIDRHTAEQLGPG